MNSQYNFPWLFDKLETLVDQNEPNWFIIKDLSTLIAESKVVSKAITFSIREDGRIFDLPFEKRPGYLVIEEDANSSFISDFRTLVKSRLNSPESLANIFIFQKRISGEESLENETSKGFKELAEEHLETIFKILVKSLNIHYFTHHHLSKTHPNNVQDWLDIFRSAQGFNNISDPVIQILDLVKGDNDNQEIELHRLLLLDPLLRAPLFGWYNFEVVDKDCILVSTLTSNVVEASFLIATVLNKSTLNSKVPIWLSQQIIDICLKLHWNEIGKELLAHSYGIRFRNKNETDVLTSLKSSVGSSIRGVLLAKDAKDDFAIDNFDFPDSYIALFNWASAEKLGDFNAIPDGKRRRIIKNLISSINEFPLQVATSLSQNNTLDFFQSYQYMELKYLNLFPWILTSLLHEEEDTFSSMKKLFYGVRPMFYGGYELRSQAIQFTEFILMILLSIMKIEAPTKKMLENWEKILSHISSTILIPYIHLTERDNRIWDIYSEYKEDYYNNAKYLINKSIGQIIKIKYSSYFDGFMRTFRDVKVALWPFERDDFQTDAPNRL